MSIVKVIYSPVGTCSNSIEVSVEDGKIESAGFIGGCPGNLLAMAKLVEGMEVGKAIELLEGIRCGHKQTSCADQLAQALKTTIRKK